MTSYLSQPDVLLIQAMVITHIGGIHGITEQGFSSGDACRVPWATADERSREQQTTEDVQAAKQ